MTPIEKAAAIREAMVSALEFIDGYSDVLDGENGNPKPNRAMTISSDLEQAIASFAALNGAGEGWRDISTSSSRNALEAISTPTIKGHPMNLDSMKKLCEAATEGPWAAHKTAGASKQCGVTTGGTYDPRSGAARRIAKMGSPRPYTGPLDAEDFNNAAFIAAARSFVPEAIREIERLRGAFPPAKPGFKWMQVPVTEDAWEGDGT